jgi:hypothetical protein
MTEDRMLDLLREETHFDSDVFVILQLEPPFTPFFQFDNARCAVLVHRKISSNCCATGIYLMAPN